MRKFYTLKEICESLDLTPRAIRYYEYIELIFPKRDGNRRLYSREEVGRLKIIKYSKRLGFKLEEIRQWLLLYNLDSNNRIQTEKLIESCAKQLILMKKKQDEIAGVITDLNQLIKDGKNKLKSLG